MPADGNNEKLSKRMSALYVATRILLLGIAAALWAVASVLFYGWPPMSGMYGVLIFLYMVVLWLLCSVFDCFAIGRARIRELSVWFSLALLFADLLLWGVRLVVAMPMTGIVLSLGVWLVQSVVGMLTMVVLTRVYFKTYPVRHVCAIIAGKDYEKRSLAKIAAYPERFSIDMVLDQADVDWGDVTHLAPRCNTVFVGDIDLACKQLLIEDNFQKSRMLTFLPSPADVIYSGVRPMQVSDALLFANSNIGLTPEQRFAKRCVDIVGALVGIAISVIPMAICAVIIKATDGGTVFYRQTRLTRDGTEFELIKLRSMRMDAEKDGMRFAAADDDRITLVGRFMRACRLDETPQFFNVLAGDIPLRILKTRPEFSEESMGAFALPAKSSTNKGKVFSQVVSCFVSGLRMRRISEFDCNCIGGMETQFLAKPVFGVSPVHSGALFQKSINGLAKAAW